MRTKREPTETPVIKDSRLFQSGAYQRKEIVKQGEEVIHGIKYLKRVFADGSAELSRFNEKTGKWTFLEFAA